MEKVVERFGNRPAVIFEGTTLTWNEVNERSNRYAHALKHLDITRGDSVSVVMENRIEFICLLVALQKIGAVASLINTNLVHCLGITGSKTCVFDGYTSEAETEKKIIRDAFEDGDAWFNTGDLMRTIDVGFSLGLPVPGELLIRQ